MQFFKIKKKKILYEKYLADKQAKEDQEIQKKEISEKKQKTVKEIKEKKEKKTKREEIIIDSNTKVIGIASLEENTGTTYISYAIYDFIKELNIKACIVKYKHEDEETDNREVYYNVDILNMYDKYNYIIIDFGNLNVCDEDAQNEYKRSNIKIMIAKYTQNYIEKIGEWIKKDNDYVRRWTFIFNQVNPKHIKKIEALMEDYKCYCLPLFYLENMDEHVKKVFKEILFKREKGKKYEFKND